MSTKNKFAKITELEFRDIIDRECKANRYFELPQSVYNDINKVEFSMENSAFGLNEHDNAFMNYPCGIVTLSNGMVCLFCNAGGDWEIPICFVVYWDGFELRGYIPKMGNLWSKKYNSAYGSETEHDDYDEEDRLDTDNSEYGMGNFEMLEDAKQWIGSDRYINLKEILDKSTSEFEKFHDSLVNVDAIYQDVIDNISLKMQLKSEHQEIIAILTKFLEEHPEHRFGQALFNFSINQFASKHPADSNHLLKDIYNDSDSDILKRMQESSILKTE